MGNWAYLPDVPPETPNTWTVCDGFHADKNGLYRTGQVATVYAATFTKIPTVGFCYRLATTNELGIALVTQNSSTPTDSRFNVYDESSGTWNDRRGAVGISAVHTNRALAQFGNITLVAIGSSGIYSRDASGTSNLASVAGSPTCTVLLVTPRNIVVALNCLKPISTGSAVGGSDAWAASDVGDYTTWSGGVAESGNLRQTPGVLTSGSLLGNDVIAFKRKGVYRGSFVNGTTFKWQWDLIHPTLGAWGPGCSVSTPIGVVFWGDDGLYVYDGQFRKLDNGVGITVNNTIGDIVGFFSGRNYLGLSMHYDPITRRVYMFNFGTMTDLGGRTVKNPQHFTYQIDSGKWGYQSVINDSATDYHGVLENAHELNGFTSGAWTYETSIGLFTATPGISMIGTEFSSSNVGSALIPKLRTYRMGDRRTMSYASRFIPGWTKSDGAGTDLSGATLKTGTPYYSDSPMEAETAGTAATLSTDLYWADFTASKRYQSIELRIGCEAVINGGEWEPPKPSGRK